MRILCTALLALTMVMLAGGFAFASDAGVEPQQAKPGDGASFWVTIAATGLSLAIAAGLGALGQSKAIAASVEAIARQPEAGGRIFVSMIIGLALIETLVIYTLVIAFMMIGRAG
jgi:F-type H+-transporting ATPase subunit c